MHQHFAQACREQPTSQTDRWQKSAEPYSSQKHPGNSQLSALYVCLRLLGCAGFQSRSPKHLQLKDQGQTIRDLETVCLPLLHHGHQEAVQGIQVGRLDQCSSSAGDEKWKVLPGSEDDPEDFAPGKVQVGSDFQQLPCLAQEWDWVLRHACQNWSAPLPRWQQRAWDRLRTLLPSELPVHHRPGRFRHHPQPSRSRVRDETRKVRSLNLACQKRRCQALAKDLTGLWVLGIVKWYFVLTCPNFDLKLKLSEVFSPVGCLVPKVYIQTV